MTTKNQKRYDEVTGKTLVDLLTDNLVDCLLPKGDWDIDLERLELLFSATLSDQNIRHTAEMAGLEAQIEQNAILGAANIIEAERKKWVEEVRGEIESLKKSKDWGDISSYESHERGVPRGFNRAIDDILNLPSLQENDDNSNP